MAQNIAQHKAHASPTKDFFVRMITKDISLEDCILDLIDNCLDGARKVKLSGSKNDALDNYEGYGAKLEFNGDNFRIEDNCGGISISEAIDYAFHFGRRPNASDGDYSIGLYGIGMKRAIFKIGTKIDIYSSTNKEAFTAPIDVQEWLSRESRPNQEDWDFDMFDARINPNTGTIINICGLHSEVAREFQNPKFSNSLARIIARDYAQFLSKGFEISINGEKVEGFKFTVRESSEFKPFRHQYEDELGVKVEIISGMAGLPPDDLLAAEGRLDTDYFGWFVLCNDRVVVASDKSDQTVWGDNGFPNWHYQYNGFIGMVSFHSKDPNLLPWRTTKRDVDSSNPIYRRAVEKMKEATRPWLKYTNDRRGNIEEAKKRESEAVAKPLFEVSKSNDLIVPKSSNTPPRVAYSSIQYQKPTSEIEIVKKLLGNPRMPNYRLGEKTFEYFLKNEYGE